MNRIIQGDNLQVLKKLLGSHKGKVDLIYIDPPFATKNVFRISHGRAATISVDKSADVAYSDVLTGQKYFDALEERLKIAHELLSDEGSLYLHMDSKIAYPVKNILDNVFKDGIFRNSISRIKSNPKNFPQKGYGSISDTILFYTKSKKYTWNEPRVKPDKSHMAKFTKEDSHGKYNTSCLHAPRETIHGETGKEWCGILPPPGRHWCHPRKKLDELNKNNMIEWSKNGIPRLKKYANSVMNKGVLLQDVWEFKDPQYTKYPTEKNLDMLQVIVRTSSNPGDLVMDFYCGSGTTLLACAMNDRKFVGIDQSEKAIECSKERLSEYKVKFVKDVWADCN